jgi:hypothetical protein
MELIATTDRGGRLLLEQSNDLIDQGQLSLLPLGLRHGRQGDLTELAQVAAQALWYFCWVQRRQSVPACGLDAELLVTSLT